MTIPEEKDKVSAQDTENTQPQTDESKTIYDESLPKGQVTLFEAADKTRAYLKIVSTTSGEQFTKDEILEIINEIGVKSEININQIEEALATLKDQGDILETIKITDSSPSAANENAAL
jgi:D-arabinose 1-dehydrogenase-like Zn-dependent alcohol dehydrogenase